MVVSAEQVESALDSLLAVEHDPQEAMHLLDVTRGVASSEYNYQPLIAWLIDHHAYRSFSVVLQRFAKDEEVCIAALKSVAAFSQEPGSEASMVEHNLPLLLIRTIRRHVTSSVLIAIGVSIMADASANAHVRNLVRIHGGIDVVADAMSIHKTDARVLDVCFYCLANLTVQSPENVVVVVESGCIQSVILGLTRFAESPTLLEGALAIIANVCRNGLNEQRVVADLNGCHALSIALDAVGDATLVRSCLTAVAMFAQCPENIDLVLDEHLIDKICIKIVENRWADPDLARVGIAAIAKIVADCSVSALVVLLDTPAIVVALAMSKLHPSEAPVQLAVLHLLLAMYSRFTISHSHLLGMIRLLALPVTLSAMHCFPGNATIATAAVTLFGGILTDNYARCRLERVDILPTVVTVAIEHTNDVDTLRLALDALSELVTMQAAATTIDKRLLDLIEHVVTDPDVNTSVLDRTLYLLSRLVCQGEMGDFVASKLGASLIALLQNPSLVQSQAGPILFTICGDIALSATGAEILVGLGILELTINVITDQSRNATLVSIILDTLRKVMRTSLRTRADLKALGAVRTTEALRFQHAGDARVMRAANDFLHDIESMVVVHKPKANAKLGSSLNAFRLPELDQNVRLFLVAGGVLTKHCKKAAPRKRQVFVSTDLRFLVWKEPGKNPRSFFLDSCERIVPGRATAELQREPLLRFAPASEMLSFAVFMKDGRHLSLEAPTPDLREQWIQSLNDLMSYRRALARMTTKHEIDLEPWDDKNEDISLFG